MTPDPVEEIIGDERWMDLARDPVKLEAAEDQLFERSLDVDPARREWYDALEQNKQSHVRTAFGGFLRERYADRFPEPAKAAEAPVGDQQPAIGDPGLAEQGFVSTARGGLHTGKFIADVAARVMSGELIVEDLAKLGTSLGYLGAAALERVGELEDKRVGGTPGKLTLWAREAKSEARANAQLLDNLIQTSNPVAKALEDVSADFDATLETVNQAYPTKRFAERTPDGDKIIHWELLKDPEYWAQTLPEFVQQLSSTIALGGGTIKGASLMGAAMEALPLAEELEKSGDPDAELRAFMFGMAVAQLEKIGLDKMFKGGSPSRLKRAAAAFVTEPATEWAEGPVGAFLQFMAREGYEAEDVTREVLQAAWDEIEVIPATALIGLAGGSGPRMSAAKREEQIRQMTEEAAELLPEFQAARAERAASVQLPKATGLDVEGEHVFFTDADGARIGEAHPTRPERDQIGEWQAGEQLPDEEQFKHFVQGLVVREAMTETETPEAPAAVEPEPQRPVAREPVVDRQGYIDLDAELRDLDAREQPTPRPGGPGVAAYVAASGENAGPGGNLGEPYQPGEVPKADSRDEHMPLELPELGAFLTQVMGGKFPRIFTKLRSKRGAALGQFRYQEGRVTGQEAIELRADIFQLITEPEKVALRQEAAAYAKEKVPDPPPDASRADRKSQAKARADMARDHYEFLFETAHRAAMKNNPALASKVIARELIHYIDFMPQGMLKRGNIFGHIAAFKKYHKQQLSQSWEDQYIDGPYKILNARDKARIKRDVERELKRGQTTIEEIVRDIPIFEHANITAGMVKAIWTDNEAREKYPELYLFLARLPPEQKKQVVKEAMNGAVDELLNEVPGRRQVGTERVVEQREVTSIVDPALFAQKFRERIQREMAQRGIITRQQILAELEPMIAWWRGTETMEPYFRTPEEMYAEAGSVMLNNPAAVRKRAPTYYRAFHEWFQRRPEIKKAYYQIQDDMKKGTIHAERVKNLRQSVLASTKEAAEVQRLANSYTFREAWDAFIYVFDRAWGPVYHRVKRISEYMGGRKARLEAAIGDYNYRKAHHEKYLARIGMEVMDPLLDMGMDSMDLFEYMFHKHILENRPDVGSPLYWSDKASAERLEEMQTVTFPGEKWRALQNAQNQFWQIRQQEVIKPLRDSQIFSDEQMQTIAINQFYAKIKPHRKDVTDIQTTIEQMMEASIGKEATVRLYKTVGYVGPIENSFLATMQQDLSLMDMALREPTKKLLIDVMSNSIYADEWAKAEPKWDGKKMSYEIKENKRMGSLVFMHHGKMQVWYGPAALVQQYTRGNAIENRLAAFIFHHGSRHFQNWMTQLNYGFWPVAYARDIGAFRDQMPGAKRNPFSKKSYWHYRKRALKAAKSSVLGRHNKDALEALDRGVWITQRERITGQDSDIPAADLFLSYGQREEMWLPKDAQAERSVRRGARRIAEIYRGWGQVRERAVKIAGMFYLDDHHSDMSEFQKREFIREFSGSPDFLQRGRGGIALNFLMPFFNPVKEGVRSGLKSTFRSPRTAGERAWKFTKYTFLPLVALEAARRGMFAALLGDDASDELQEMLNAIPRYDWDNYECIPLGWVDREQGKVAYFRRALHDNERVLRGVLAKAMRSDQETMRFKDLANVAGAQLPGWNPIFKTAIAWHTYKVTGHPPIDVYSGVQILSDDMVKADQSPEGDWHGDWAMAQYTWDTMGGGIIHRFGAARQYLPNPEKKPLEKFLALPVISNLLGRWIKVSSRGLTVPDEQIDKMVDNTRALARVKAQQMIALTLAGKPLTDAQIELLQTDEYLEGYYSRKLDEVHELRSMTPRQRAEKKASSKVALEAMMEDRFRRGDY